MAVHRKRGRRLPAGPPRLPRGSYRGVIEAGGDLGAAAEIIRDEAARLAAGQGLVETAQSLSVEAGETTAIVYSDAPAAYPNEVDNVWHPTYGHKPWVLNKHRPFLAPAAEAKATEALERWAKKWDRLLERAGFKPE